MTQYHEIKLTCAEADFIIASLDDSAFPTPYRFVSTRKRITKKLLASCPETHKQTDLKGENHGN